MKRRTVLKGIGLIGLGFTSPELFLSSDSNLIHRAIPATGEKIPVIGMGSWLTFDVKGSLRGMANMKKVLSTFYREGGRVLDSSPMYGSSEEVIGILARELGIMKELWISTKVWTTGKDNGRAQIRASDDYFSSQVMVNHVHNMRDFATHYATLREWKERGALKYIGVTHYINSTHDELASLIKRYDLDFVQFNFNIDNPHAERALIPTAVDQGVATIINRPLKGGRLFNMIGHTPLPPWAKEYDIRTWAAYFLKYIVAHPGITCAVPATTQVPHVLENMEAGRGYLPSAAKRKRMYEYFQSVV